MPRGYRPTPDPRPFEPGAVRHKYRLEYRRSDDKRRIWQRASWRTFTQLAAAQQAAATYRQEHPGTVCVVVSVQVLNRR